MAFLATWDQVPKAQLLEVRPAAKEHDRRVLHTNSCMTCCQRSLRHGIHVFCTAQQANTVINPALARCRCSSGATSQASRRCAPTSGCSTESLPWA